MAGVGTAPARGARRGSASAVTPGADAGTVDADFRAAVLEGLTAERKWLSPRFLYDRVGAKLFEAITLVDDYYPTRTERELIEASAAEIANALGDAVVLVEPGSGDGQKARLLLDALGPRAAAYVPIDIAADQLAAVAADTAARYPGLAVEPVAADFTGPLRLPRVADAGNVAIFFPGSTIGNMEPAEAAAFLARIRTGTGAGTLVIGVDLEKDRAILERAYDDPADVTAAFDKNLLQRINRELDGTFDLSRFRHAARYDERLKRVEMHLVSLVEQTVFVAGEPIAFAAGETIHTESSYKYSVEAFAALAARAGWRPSRTFVDARRLFALHLMRACRAA